MSLAPRTQLSAEQSSVEVRAVWHVSSDEATSLSLNRLDEGISTYGRQPDAFGVYETDAQGLQMFVDERRTIEQAQELAIEVVKPAVDIVQDSVAPTP